MAQCRVVIVLSLFSAVASRLLRSGAAVAHADHGHHLRRASPREADADAEPKPMIIHFHASEDYNRNETPSCAYDFPYVGEEAADRLNVTRAIRRAYYEDGRSSPRTSPSARCPEVTNTTYGRVDNIGPYVYQPECVVSSCTNETYSEITQYSAARIFNDSRVALKANDTFVDLLSGRGKLILNAAVMVGAHAIGVENSSLRYRSGCRVLKSLADSDRMRRQASSGNSTVSVELRNETIWQTDLSTADVVYVASLCFDQDLMRRLARHFARRLKVGTRVVSLRRFPDVRSYWGDSVRLIHTTQLRATMTGNDPNSPSSVHVYRAIM